ncbi:biotin/acetyl-CoA-carboxylase ligase [[Leptolyngbya] sp. PCC 7376]|uniref:biotin--[acetyl-CoA-carboxylase] ligase n=1 Tax=[Leptolyngbya] sp. PCC 7376 TaxID=111781 RepID=UPI00029F20E7|nr:biotin--[acetyl-CoA-carboxylase] ligase [[Leptolyngbya] sp. PCC 7376]AFY38456.1 biotin/acetyl-CoA-carboxylase ligase [[Leptolyngbya] sp. PCC 7376]
MDVKAIASILEQFSGSREELPEIEMFEEIGSTNEVLWERFQAQEKMPRVAIAQRQTAGRGQWGKTWTSSEGGLFLSILVPITLDPQDAYGLTIASVWGIASRLQEAVIPVEVKWANDLLLQGKKLGGIKTETKVQQGKVTAAVIGVGINYCNPVPDVGINLETFWANQRQFSIEYLAALVIAGISEAIALLKNEGMDSILPNYLKLLKNLNELIVYEGHLGKIVGVNGKGELLVLMEAEGSRSTIKIPPGGVSLGYDG